MNQKLRVTFAIIIGIIIGLLIFYSSGYLGTPARANAIIYIVLIYLLPGFVTGFLATHIGKTKNLLRTFILSFVSGFLFYIFVLTYFFYTQVQEIEDPYSRLFGSYIIIAYNIPNVVTSIIGGFSNYSLRKMMSKMKHNSSH